MTWTQKEALELCVLVESFAPKFGCHVALTGGTLYKGGERKDCDIMLYRIRQWKQIDASGLFEALRSNGIDTYKHFGWCHKARYKGRDVDLFFPEELKDWAFDGSAGDYD